MENEPVRRWKMLDCSGICKELICIAQNQGTDHVVFDEMHEISRSGCYWEGEIACVALQHCHIGQCSALNDYHHDLGDSGLSA